MLLAIASCEIGRMAAVLIIWWAKPWLDRTILFVLSRAAFGQPTRPRDVWRAQRDVWWRHLLLTLVRSGAVAVAIAHAAGAPARRADVRQGARSRVGRSGGGAYGTALMMTHAFSLAEGALTLALLSLVFWLAPSGARRRRSETIFAGELPALFSIRMPIAYGIAVLFLEPFYVAAGFAMYLNRRAELEAWDIEQEFRRAFAA